jgi:uncharacterized cupredoxin-like copper-binding protein
MSKLIRVTAALFLIAACGGGEETSDSLQTTVSEFQFAPSTWTVAADSAASIEVTNAGSMTHEWVLMNPDVQIASEAEFTEDLVYIETEVEAGATETLDFTAPAAGTYQVICAIPSHFDAGMEGTLTVTDQ